MRNELWTYYLIGHTLQQQLLELWAMYWYMQWRRSCSTRTSNLLKYRHRYDKEQSTSSLASFEPPQQISQTRGALRLSFICAQPQFWPINLIIERTFYSDWSDVPTRGPFELADGFPKFLTECSSRLQEHHRPANLVFSVLDQIANLLARVQGPATLHLAWLGDLNLPWLKNCARPPKRLNPALHYHRCGPCFTHYHSNNGWQSAYALEKYRYNIYI